MAGPRRRRDLPSVAIELDDDGLALLAVFGPLTVAQTVRELAFDLNPAALARIRNVLPMRLTRVVQLSPREHASELACHPGPCRRAIGTDGLHGGVDWYLGYYDRNGNRCEQPARICCD